MVLVGVEDFLMVARKCVCSQWPLVPNIRLVSSEVTSAPASSMDLAGQPRVRRGTDIDHDGMSEARPQAPSLPIFP